MSKIVFELDRAGVRELLQSAEMAEICEDHARRLTLAAGVPYRADILIGRNRVNARGSRSKGGNRDTRNDH